ncbi:uncharacterized protein CXQ87_001656 [Candidozyma duobushaemuli]|uniref:RRM domain-containing protein n=1 Tax=Candidozyma duobushaemuli TaxID=1231522 RepID=A0A2V1A612_9ASCO|nr:uncharacterized protein CXQ87_001656 [[Candida] duobushaemulonis]PVH13550.1 hypothetical protein CXQ87_001656 [[Candida] duobushaemulonis]
MPKNTLYVTGFTKESKAADLAPDFEKTDDGEKYAFVEYKTEEDCEKALELDGKPLPYAKQDGLVVQMARSDPYSARRGSFRGSRGFRGGRGGGYGYGYGYERGGYGYPAPHPYPPPRGGRDPYYDGYGYGREPYGYRDRRYDGPGDERDSYRDRADRYVGDRGGRDRDFETRDEDRSRDAAGPDSHEPNGNDEYSRGRYSRSASPQRERSRSRSPSR